MLWEQFRNHALSIIREHFPPELIEDNGDRIVFTSRRDYRTYILTEDERGIVIAYEGERNTVIPLCLELTTTCLTLLARDGIATLTDMSYTPQDLLGPVPHTAFTISKKSLPFFDLTSTINPALSAKCRSFTCARAITEANGPKLPRA